MEQSCIGKFAILNSKITCSLLVLMRASAAVLFALA